MKRLRQQDDLLAGFIETSDGLRMMDGDTGQPRLPTSTELDLREAITARYEYRVTWKRDGLPRRRQIFQTDRGAREKVDNLLTLEETKHTDWDYGTNPFQSLPDISEAPTVERRFVGAWEASAIAEANR